MMDAAPKIEAPPRSEPQVTLASHKACPICLVSQPLEQFRVHRRRNGKEYRARECSDCHCRIERARRKERKTAEDHRILHNSWASLAKHKHKRLAIEGIIAPLWHRFGGAAGIATAWQAAYNEATAVRRLRALEAFVAMLNWLVQNPDILAETRMLTDQQLHDELQSARIQATAELIKVQPHVAAAIAKQLGYALTPISGSNV